jgi:hypothetical protein
MTPPLQPAPRRAVDLQVFRDGYDVLSLEKHLTPPLLEPLEKYLLIPIRNQVATKGAVRLVGIRAQPHPA